MDNPCGRRGHYDQSMTQTVAYPEHWEADVVLRDGSTMQIRPIHPDDGEALQKFHMGQSQRSQYYRFFAPMAKLSDSDLHRFTHVDHKDRVALVMVTGDEIIGVGRYDRLVEDREYPDGDVAEVAFNVSDASQGKGLGSILLEHLAAAGRERGIRMFVADVLPANTKMLRVFTYAGYDVKQRFDDGVVSVNFTIRPTDRSMEVLAERERRAEALSMGRILAAESVLIYGSGQEGGKLAALMEQRVRESDFTGEVYTAHSPQDVAEALTGRTDPLDLAVVSAPAAEVLELLPTLGEAHTGALLVPTGGFSTVPGEEGVPQEELLRGVRRHGIRLVGPRSYGAVAWSEKGALPTILTLEPPVTARDGVGLFCQSSHAARMLLDGAQYRRLPVSTVLAAGHRADVSGNDTMQFWAQMGDPKVACIHLETIGNPRKFSRVARHLAQNRPVIATIAGSTGQVRPPGHPVRVTRTPRRALEELMSQAGVLLADSVRQQLDWATVFTTQPLPEGPRVAVITNSGTHLAVLQELLEGAGLQPADHATALNPAAGPSEYNEALEGLASTSDWDAALITYDPYLEDESGAIGSLVAGFAARSQRTVLAQIHDLAGLRPELTSGGTQVPAFLSGADAIRALGAMYTYAQRRDQESSPRVDPAGINRRGADEFLNGLLADVGADQTHELTPEQARELLGYYGLDVLPASTVRTPEEAVAAADRIGWPVALKTSDSVLRHRSDLGGVRLDLGSETELRQAWQAMAKHVENLGRGDIVTFEIQAMAPTGVAGVLVAQEDPLYGPIMSFGISGVAIELLEDVSYRVPPLTERDAFELVTSVRAAPRLFGHGDLPRLDVEGLVDVVARLSLLKEELAGVLKVELNPVLVGRDSATIISAEVWITQPARGDIARRVLP